MTCSRCGRANDVGAQSCWKCGGSPSGQPVKETESEEEEESDQITTREAVDVMGRLRFFLGQGMAFIADAPNPEVAVWQFSFALGSDNCVGHTMTSKAAELGVSAACISKGATRVCRMLDIPPSPYMLPKEAQESYRKLRRDQEAERAATATRKGAK